MQVYAKIEVYHNSLQVVKKNLKLALWGHYIKHRIKDH